MLSGKHKASYDLTAIVTPISPDVSALKAIFFFFIEADRTKWKIVMTTPIKQLFRLANSKVRHKVSDKRGSGNRSAGKEHDRCFSGRQKEQVCA